MEIKISIQLTIVQNSFTLCCSNKTHSMKFNRFTAIIFISTLFILVSSCGGNKESNNDIETTGNTGQVKFILMPDADTILPTWSKENIVVNHWPNDPDNLHPTNGGTTGRSWVLGYTSNYLLRSDPVNQGVTPDIALEMPEISADNLQYTYHLRKDAKWDDGSTITAEDIIFTIKASACPLVNNPQAKPYFENISEITSNKSDEIIITMKREYIQNIYFVGDMPIMERKFHDPENVLANYSIAQFNDPGFQGENEVALTTWANEFNDQKYGTDLSLLNGSGPYKVVSWNRGQTLELQKKQNHWTSQIKDPGIYEAAYPDKIIFKIVKDPNSQLLEFRAQTIDVSTWLTTETVLDLMKDPEFNKNYNVKFADRYDYNYMGMNMRPDGTVHKQFFNDVKVRRAMAYLVPLDNIISIVSHGYAKRMASCVSPLKPEYNSDLALIPYDVEAAKKLLDEAGWKDTDGDNVRDKLIDGVKTPFRFELKYQGGQTFVEDVVRMIKEAMYPAGVDVILVSTEPNTLREQLGKHDFDMYLSAWSSSSLPEDLTQLFATASYADGGSNYCGFGNAESDALLDSIKYTIDAEKRNPMMQHFQKILYDEQPYIFMYATARKIVIHKRFGNQYMTFDRPGVVLNDLKLLSAYKKE